MGDVRGDVVDVPGEEDRGPLDLLELLVAQHETFEEVRDVHRVEGREEAALPVDVDHDDREGDRGDDQAPVPAGRDLERRREEVDEVGGGDPDRDQHPDVLVALEEDHRDHDPRDRHRAHHREAVRRGQVDRCLEDEEDEEDREHQEPVHRVDVDLGAELRRGVIDLEEREDPGRDPLVRDREDPRDHRLRGDDCRRDREGEERDVEEGGLGEDHLEEDVLRAGVRDEERTLPEVVQDERNEDEEPGPPDRFPAEVAHVGEERLAAGRAEDHLREDEEGGDPVGQEEGEAVQRVDREEDRRRLEDREHPRYREGDEPEDHDRPERPGDPLGPAPLEGEEPDRDERGDPDERDLGDIRRSRDQP